MPSSTREERLAPRSNRVLDRVRAGKYVLCGSTTPYPSPKIAEMMGLIGFDCVWIDMEHQDFSYDQAFNICLGARAAQMESMIRVRKAGDYSFFRVFEAGATGIMVPHIRSMEEAKWALKFCRFSPVGLRGMDGVEAAARYGLVPMAEYMEWSLRETFVIFQVEDREALDILDDVAQMEGLDGLFFGPSDMSQSLGIACEFDHPRLAEAQKRVASAAAKHGKFWGMPVPDAARAKQLYEEQGALFFACGSPVTLLRRAYLNIREDFDHVFGQ